MSNNNLNIYLIEHPVINELVIIGEPSNKYKEEIKKIIKSKEKNSYIKSNVAKDVDLIKQLYGSVGLILPEKKVTKRQDHWYPIFLIFLLYWLIQNLMHFY